MRMRADNSHGFMQMMCKVGDMHGCVLQPEYLNKTAGVNFLNQTEAKGTSEQLQLHSLITVFNTLVPFLTLALLRLMQMIFLINHYRVVYF